MRQMPAHHKTLLLRVNHCGYISVGRRRVFAVGVSVPQMYGLPCINMCILPTLRDGGVTGWGLFRTTREITRPRLPVSDTVSGTQGP